MFSSVMYEAMASVSLFEILFNIASLRTALRSNIALKTSSLGCSAIRTRRATGVEWYCGCGGGSSPEESLNKAVVDGYDDVEPSVESLGTSGGCAIFFARM